MNLREALEAEHSKAQTIRIVDFIGGSRKRFGDLLAIVTGENRKLAQRGAWAISHCAEAHPSVIEAHLETLLENVQRPDLHDAIKRNTMKALSLVEVPDELAGLAAQIAFTFLGSPDEAVATRVYSMAVLERLCRHEPELAGELRLSIESQLPFETKPAFHSRARHVLRSLDRIEARSS